MTALPEHPLPVKPRYLEACNGCGLCCTLELCEAAKMVLPKHTEAPCPMLVFRADRTYCGLVLTERANGLQPIIEKALGVGNGCSMEDDDTP